MSFDAVYSQLEESWKRAQLKLATVQVERDRLKHDLADARALLREGARALRAHACDCGRDDCEPCAVAKRMGGMG
jgi:hypothetical protein